MVLGGSWGSTLALAYAVRFPSRVSELVLFGVTTGRREEFDWLFRDGLRRFFPKAWERRLQGVPPADRDGDVDIVESYHRQLNQPDPGVRERAARDWCMWESATPDWPPTQRLAPRFRDPVFAVAYARVVTHYVRHDAWLGVDGVLADVGKLVEIPTVLIAGRFDFQAPLATAWDLHHRLPNSELVVVTDAGHAAHAPGLTRELVRATDRLGIPGLPRPDGGNLRA